MSGGPIVLFDGVCNLCSAAVQFILDRDSSAHFRFASLQSDVGAKLIADRGLPPIVGDPDSIYLLDDDGVHARSTAALRIARGLRAPWPLFYVFVAVPRPLRDLVYRFVASNRYRWFGKTEQCWIPTPELRARFLDHARPA